MEEVVVPGDYLEGMTLSGVEAILGAEGIAVKGEDHMILTNSMI